MPNRYFHADDWGLSPGINAGILELARRGWLRGVSCMANTRYHLEGLAELLEIPDLQFSMHFNLTYGEPISAVARNSALVLEDGKFGGLKRLISKTWFGQEFSAAIEEEFAAQFQVLKSSGIPLSGIDGHHHIHLLPQVYRVLHEIWIERGLTRLRLAGDRSQKWSWLQSQWAERFLIRPEDGFEPIVFSHLLEEDLDSEEKFFAKLNRAPLIVHPALYDDFAQTQMTDPLQRARIEELRQIMGYLI